LPLCPAACAELGELDATPDELTSACGATVGELELAAAVDPPLGAPPLGPSVSCELGELPAGEFGAGDAPLPGRPAAFATGAGTRVTQCRGSRATDKNLSRRLGCPGHAFIPADLAHPSYALRTLASPK